MYSTVWGVLRTEGGGTVQIGPNLAPRWSRRTILALHIVALLAVGNISEMAQQTGVSGPVVVDGESFLDALFASAGQG